MFCIDFFFLIGHNQKENYLKLVLKTVLNKRKIQPAKKNPAILPDNFLQIDTIYKIIITLNKTLLYKSKIYSFTGTNLIIVPPAAEL